MKKNTKYYNCLGCPQCSTPLHDSLIELELNYPVKTVKCENCDFIGYRQGWQLLSKNQENEYREITQKDRRNLVKVSTYQRVRA